LASTWRRTVLQFMQRYAAKSGGSCLIRPTTNF